ncbi:MAG: Gfo/Idh/MocA family protein, partial [Candidatus Promineifilaceae bacterium]
LLEKPMVMNAAEAASLVAAQQRTGRLLVVAFNGSLSPHIRRAADALRSGEFGRLLGISAVVWEDWQPMTAGSWRQQAAVSGGGFLFDTGAHMLNTICDLAGEEFAEVAAWLDNRGAPVEIVAAAIGRLASGALVSLHACGATIPSCHSDVRLFCEGGIIRTGIWGEFLEIQRPDAAFSEPRHLTPTASAWEQFLAVRAGRLANPCPPEVGLRMARLYDAICASAAQGGRPVLVG